MATSSAVTAGTNATASQYNNVRTDAITRYVRFVFDIRDRLVVGDTQGQKYIIPSTMTVTAIKHLIGTGTSATFRIKKDASTVDASIVAGTTIATESSITSAGLVADQILTLDITAVSGSPTNLLVEVLCTETI